MRFARPNVRLQTWCLVLLSALFNSACVYRFANQDRQLSLQPKTIYVSPVVDTTARAGQAAKLMNALRRKLTHDRAFIMTDLQTARWGLELQIIESGRSITRVEKCTQGNEVLGGGAVPCSQVATSGRLPDISAEEEVAKLTIDARAIDLQTGTLLFQTRLADLSSGAYNIVGDGTVRSSLSNATDLHALRSMENRDNAIEAIANAAAARIYDQLISIPPPSPSL